MGALRLRNKLPGDGQFSPAGATASSNLMGIGSSFADISTVGVVISFTSASAFEGPGAAFVAISVETMSPAGAEFAAPSLLSAASPAFFHLTGAHLGTVVPLASPTAEVASGDCLSLPAASSPLASTFGFGLIAMMPGS